VLHTAAIECANSLAGVRGDPPVELERAKRALATFIDRGLFSTE